MASAWKLTKKVEMKRDKMKTTNKTKTEIFAPCRNILAIQANPAKRKWAQIR